MKKVLSHKEYSNMSNNYEQVKYQCSCGHKVVIPYWVDKQLCSWCKNYVFKNKQDEFKYRMKEKLNERLI